MSCCPFPYPSPQWIFPARQHWGARGMKGYTTSQRQYPSAPTLCDCPDFHPHGGGPCCPPAPQMDPEMTEPGTESYAQEPNGNAMAGFVVGPERPPRGSFRTRYLRQYRPPRLDELNFARAKRQGRAMALQASGNCLSCNSVGPYTGLNTQAYMPVAQPAGCGWGPNGPWGWWGPAGEGYCYPRPTAHTWQVWRNAVFTPADDGMTGSGWAAGRRQEVDAVFRRAGSRRSRGRAIAGACTWSGPCAPGCCPSINMRTGKWDCRCPPPPKGRLTGQGPTTQPEPDVWELTVGADGRTALMLDRSRKKRRKGKRRRRRRGRAIAGSWACPTNVNMNRFSCQPGFAGGPGGFAGGCPTNVNMRRFSCQGYMGAHAEALPRLLASLRAMYTTAQTAHWQCKGPGYYGQHIMLQRIYEGVEKGYDGLAERIVSYVGAAGVDPVEQTFWIAQDIAQWKDIACPVERTLAAALYFRQQVTDTFHALKEAGHLSLGLDDYLMTLASQNDEYIYLLEQATATHPEHEHVYAGRRGQLREHWASPAAMRPYASRDTSTRALTPAWDRPTYSPADAWRAGYEEQGAWQRAGREGLAPTPRQRRRWSGPYFPTHTTAGTATRATGNVPMLPPAR